MTELGLTALCAVLGLLWQDNIKSKALYLNLLFFAFALYMLRFNPANLEKLVFPLLPFVLLLDWSLMLALVSASDEVYVSQMGGFAGNLKGNLLLSLLAAVGFAAAVLQEGESWPFVLYLSLSLGGLAACLHNIYFGTCGADEKVCALLRNAGWRYALPVLAMVACFGWRQPLPDWRWLAACGGGFVVLLLVWPQRLGNLLARADLVQNFDWLSALYRFFIVAPIQLLGRILWLSVDFVVIERRVIGTVSDIAGAVARKLEESQSESFKSRFGWLLLGLLLLAANIGGYAYE